MIGLCVMLLVLIIYFLPGILASCDNKRNTAAIWILNFFLGWTILGWVGALIWAVVEREK